MKITLQLTEEQFYTVIAALRTLQKPNSNPAYKVWQARADAVLAKVLDAGVDAQRQASDAQRQGGDA